MSRAGDITVANRAFTFTVVGWCIAGDGRLAWERYHDWLAVAAYAVMSASAIGVIWLLNRWLWTH